MLDVKEMIDVTLLFPKKLMQDKKYYSYFFDSPVSYLSFVLIAATSVKFSSIQHFWEYWIPVSSILRFQLPSPVVGATVFKMLSTLPFFSQPFSPIFV